MEFSVVITAFNCKRFIEKSLHSVFSQTYSPKEVIVIDDASTDRTYPLLQRWGKKYPTLRVVRNKQNFERCKSRNLGVKLAKGDFVCFLDCDDLWLERYLEKTFEAINGGHSAVFGLPKVFVNSEGKITRKKKPPQDGFETLLFEGRVGYPSGSCFNRETFLRLGGYLQKYLMREDWEIFLRFYLAGEKVAFIPSHEYAIREHSLRTSRGNKRFLQATLRVYKDYLKKTPDEFKPLLKYHLAVQLLRFNKKGIGRRLIFSLFVENPSLFKKGKRVWEALKRLF
ncbi:MAG TPA: glycosyltransferase family 2 protein [Aquifex aeolicus]|uniref:Glycosyltransferase family 2 protein n=1 Tax=Aquifex aeolicus TaxID=63363 RepID=A0A9D1CES3_AQUAO|nr:glycosyltransferase family 2 protein [Aquifex aeolicus]